MLISAKAMGASMLQLKPFFFFGWDKRVKEHSSWNCQGWPSWYRQKPGCNDGGRCPGWTVIDLGVDVPSSVYWGAGKNPGAVGVICTTDNHYDKHEIWK